MKQVTFKKINSYSGVTMYQATDGDTTIPFELRKTTDKIGTLYLVYCSKIGYFEEYGMKAVKKRITKTFEHGKD